MIAAIELAKQLRESQALVDDLENQIAEGLAGMDKAEGRVAELEEVLASAVTNIDGLVNDSRGVDGWHLNGDIASWDELEPFLEWIAIARQALSGDGSAVADVVPSGLVKEVLARYGDHDGDCPIWWPNGSCECGYAEALDKMDGKETQDG